MFNGFTEKGFFFLGTVEVPEDCDWDDEDWGNIFFHWGYISNKLFIDSSSPYFCRWWFQHMIRVEHSVAREMIDMREPGVRIYFFPLHECSLMSHLRVKNCIAIHGFLPIIGRVFLCPKLKNLDDSFNEGYMKEVPLKLSLVVPKGLVISHHSITY